MDLQADAQTALVNQGNKLTSAQVDDSAIAAEYKDILGSIKSDKTTLLGQIQASIAKLGALKVSHEQLVAMFLNDVTSTYPELKDLTVDQVLQKISSATGAVGMPLLNIWEKYHQQIVDVEQQTATTLSDYNAMMSDWNNIEGQQDSIIQSYASFYDGSEIKGIPSPDDLMNSVEAESLIPPSDASSVIADASIMDYLDPEARAAIELQLANNDQADLPVPSNQNAFMNAQGRPTIKFLGLALGLAAFAYILFGGSSAKQTS